MNVISLIFFVFFGLSANVHAETPQISQILSQETREDIAISIPFTVTADSAIVSVSLKSSNQTLVPDEYLLYESDANFYTIVATPKYDLTGATMISLTVTSLNNQASSTDFILTVTDVDDSMYFWKNYQTAAKSIESLLRFPTAVAVDPATGKIFVSDAGNHRVLRFSKENTTIAEAVFGDTGDTMNEPTGLHFDHLGRLWVADTNNHRVLRFDQASSKPTRAPPDAILGRANFVDPLKTSQDAMNKPTDVWVDPTGTLWVADSKNHRILRFDHAAQKENYANADAVLGQPDFTTLSYDVTQSKMETPRSIVIIQGHLFVADYSNNRILCFKNVDSKSFLAPADFVLGQPDFVTKEKNLSATGMDLPSGLAIDMQGRLYVAEQNNNRVLIFDDVIHKSNGDAANNVLGQPSFLSNSTDTSYQSLFLPYVLGYDPMNNHLWVPELFHHRILRFDLNIKQAPFLGIIQDLTIDEDTPSNPITFTVTDNNDQSLTITYESANEDLISANSFKFSGEQVTSDNHRVSVFATSVTTTVNLVLTPEVEQSGSTTISITVTDPHGMTDIQTFTLNVSEINDLPSITSIKNQTINEDTESEPIQFTVTDIEKNQLQIEVSAENSDLFPSNSNNITLSNDSGGNSWQLTTNKGSDVLTLWLRPATNQSGTSMITVTVYDGQNEVHTNFSMTVMPQNDPPILSRIVDQTIDEDTLSQAIPFTIFDPDARSLTLTIYIENQLLIPSDNQHLTLINASFLKDTCYTLTTDSESIPLTLYILAESNLSGASVLTITVSDGELSNSQAFTMTVLSVDDPPTLSHIADQATFEETPLTGIGFTVNDVDTNTLAIEILSNTPDIIPSDPTHMTLSNAIGDTGYTLLAKPLDMLWLTLMPAPNATGIAEIIVKVSDETTDTSISFSVTVSPINDAPVLSPIENQYGREDTRIKIPFVVSDQDADPLTLTIATGNDLLIPSDARHLSFQTADGQFSNTLLTIPGGEAISLTVLPLLNQSGKTEITITATDGIAHVSTAFILSITAVNDAPTLSPIDHQTVFEDTQSNPIPFTVSDVDGDILYITVSSSHSILIPSERNHITLSNATGDHAYTLTTHADDHLHVTLLPSFNQSGSAMISITVTDGTLQSSESFTMTVIPVNDAPIISAISNFSMDEDTVSPQILFSIADPEFDTLTIEIQSNNEDLIATHTQSITLQGETGGSAYTLISNPGPLTLTLQPKQNQIGTSEIIVHATDGEDASSRAFTVTVTEVNDAPMISFIPNQTTLEDTQSTSISFNITDVDATQLTIDIQSGNENLLPLNASHITLCSASGGNTYSLLIHENRAALTLSVLPAPNQAGNVSLTVQVSDEYSSVNQSFILSIQQINDPPIIDPVADHLAQEDMSTINIPFTAYDFENPACSLGVTLISSNETLLANDHLSYLCDANMYTIFANPSQDQNGHLDITIMVTDQDGELTTRTFGLTLIPVNDPATIYAPSQVRVKMNNLTPISGIYIDDCDAGNEHLVIRLETDDGTIMMSSQQGEHLSFTGTLAEINSALNSVDYSPTFNALGSRSITVSVNDMGHSGQGGSQISLKTIVLKIHDNNVPPVNYLPTLTMNEDESLHITPISVFDLDAAANAIEVTLSTKNGYFTLDETESLTLIAGNDMASTCIVLSGSQYHINQALEHLTLTCTTHFNGWVTLTMTTNDLGHTGEGYSPMIATNAVPITVLATIDPPTHLMPERISLIEDIPTAFTACVRDPDGDDIIFVELEVNTGTIQLRTGKGLTGYLGTSPLLSFTGRKTDVNDAMKGMIFNPTANVAGNYTFTMTYKDMDFAFQAVSIPLQILAINDPPMIDMDTSARTINEDTSLTLSISVDDIEAGENDIQVFLNSSHSLLKINQTMGVTVFPSNMSQCLTLTGSMANINAALKAVVYSPTKDYYGNSFISVNVDDQGYLPLPAESSQKDISITIMPVNDPPNFDLSPETIVVLEDFSSPQIISLTQHVSVFGEPTQVTYTLSPEPETITWASIRFEPEKGLITITAIENKNGSALFFVVADDGALENNIARHPFSFTVVAVDDPPVFMLSRDQVVVNEDFLSTESITLIPGVIPEDEPQAITYALSPASLTWVNLTIDSETGQISITRIPHQHGEQLISVIADDGAITARQTFSLTVLSINDAPQITSNNHFSINENSAIGTKVHTITATDADNISLLYHIDTIGPAESFSISTHTGDIFIIGNLDYETIQDYTMTVCVSDGLTSVYQTIVATLIDLNDAPMLLNVPEKTQTTYTNESFEILDIKVEDIDAGSHPIQLTLVATNGIVSITDTSLTLESGNYSTTSLSVSGTITSINRALKKIHFSPKTDYKGPAALFIEVNDLGHTGPGPANSNSEFISIIILNYNEPPVFTNYSTHQTCLEDQPLTQTIVILDEDAIDEAIQLTIVSENGSLTLATLSQLTKVLYSEHIQSYTGSIQAFNLALDGLIFTPEKDFNGTAKYTLFANDLGHSGIGGPQIAEPAVITITCIAVNDPPIHALPLQVTGLEDTDIPLTLTVSDIDAYTNAIHVQLSAHQGQISLSNMDGLTFNPNNGIAETRLSFTGTIEAINDAMRPLIFHPASNFYGLAGISITSNDLGFSGQHGHTEAKTDTDDLTITVINVNDAPVFHSSPLQIIGEDHVYSYTIQIMDVDGDPISLTTTTLPDWLTFTDYGNNTFMIQGIPRNEHVGQTAPLTIVATDPGQATVFQSFMIDVINTNDAPFFHSAPMTQATEDSLYQYTITAGDVDPNASLTIIGNELPDWLQLKDYGNGTALLFGSPDNDDVGAINVVILSVSDGITPTKQAFMIHVINANDPPEIISSPVMTAIEDTFYNCIISAYDMDGDPVSFIGTVLPDWLTITNIGENKAVIQGTPLNQHVGSLNALVITAQDPYHATATQSFAITVTNTNDPPTFSSEPITEATEDSLYVYTITVQDIDIGASIMITAPILSDWLTFVDHGDGTALLSGIPLNENVGIKNAAVIHATDDMIMDPNHVIKQEFIITVSNTNDPPTIDSTPVLTAIEDASYSYTLIAEDVDGDLLEFTAAALPEWLTLIDNHNNTATLQGMPENEHVGITQPLSITAKDPDHGEANQYFSITVQNTNDTPVFKSQPKTTAFEDSLYAYTVTVQDVDIDDSISIKAPSLPHWLSLTDMGNGTAIIKGIPLNEDVHKDNMVLLTADDGIEFAESQAFMIAVINTNDAPTITSPAVLTATEDEPYVYTIIADDMDGDRLEFSAELPSWLSLIDHGNNTATLEGIPKNNDVGLSRPLTITTTDPSSATAKQCLEILVINTNDAPIFLSTPKETAIEDSRYSYTVAILDVDHDASIQIEAVVLPDWLQIVDHGNATALITGTPLNEHVHVNHPLVIIASDGIASEITQTFSIEVTNTNDSPEITSPAALTATEDNFYAYTVVGKDIDNDPLSFIAQMPSWLTIVRHGNNTATLKGTPTNDNVGISTPIVITAIDPDHATATQTFMITIRNTNDAPTFESLPITSALEDSAYTYNIRVHDIDMGANITIEMETLPEWLTFVDHGNGIARLTGIPKNEHVGYDAMRITATDGIASEISQAFTITVFNTNDPPVITTISLPSVNEDSYYHALITGDDMDGDTITFSVSSLPGWLTFTNNDNNSATLQGVPTNNDIGQTETFLITATDPDGVTATQSFSFEVFNTNDSPKFISIPKTEAIEDQAYHHILQVQDIDPDPVIQFSALQLPDWLTMTDNGNGTAVLTGTPRNENVGNDTIVITAADGIALPVPQTFTIHVANTNDPPVIISTAIQTGKEDSRYHYLVTGNDVDGDRIRFIAAGLPSWLKLSENGNNTANLEGVPTNNDIGTTGTITITAIDPSHTIATQSFQISVFNTNDAPWFISKPNTFGIEDITYMHTIRVKDIDPDPSLTIMATTLPSWLTLIDNKNGTARLTGKPLNEHVGNHAVEVASTDGLSSPVSQAFTIWVTNTNDAPVITSISKPFVYEDSLYTYPLNAEDVDGEDHINYSTNGLPEWLTFTDNGDNTALLQGVPENKHVGETSLITVTVTDLSGETDSQSFTILVINTNDGPEISPISSQTSPEYASTFPLSFTVADMDGDRLSISASSSAPSVVAIDASHLTFCNHHCHAESIVLTPTYAIQQINLTILPIKDGVAGITITVADAELSASSSFVLTVTNVNIPPQMSHFPDIIIDEDTLNYPISFTVVDADCDGRYITVTVFTDAPALLPTNESNISIGENGLSHHLIANTPVDLDLLINPLHHQSGLAKITVTVIDADGDFAIRNFQMTVNQLKEDPPELYDIKNISIVEDTAAYQTDVTVMDPDGGNLALAVHSSNHKLLPQENVTIIPYPTLSTHAHIPESLTLTMCPLADESGAVTITIRVTDEQHHVSEISFMLTVIPANDAPIISDIQSITINEDACCYPISFYIADADGDHLSINAISDNEQLISHSDIQFEKHVTTVAGIKKRMNGALSLKENAIGSAQVTIIVTDSSGKKDRSSFDITVNPINDMPYISQIDHQFVNENQMSLPIEFSISDAESGNLRIYAQTSNNIALPVSCITFAGTSSGSYETNVSSGEPSSLTLVIFSPTEMNTTLFIKLSVYDSSNLHYTTQFPLTILPVNDMPEFDLKDFSIDVNEDAGPLLFMHWASNISSGAYNEFDSLSFRVKTQKNELFAKKPQIEINGTTGHLTFTPAANAYGTALIGVALTDGYSTTTEKSFMINIHPMNDPPSLNTTITTRSTFENQSFSPIPFNIADVDDDKFTLTITTDNVLFSDIAICKGMDCQHCSQTACVFQYEQTSQHSLLKLILEQLKRLTNCSDELSGDIPFVDKTTLAEAIYYLNHISTSFFLNVRPKPFQSGAQFLTMMISDEAGRNASRSISFSITPVSTPPQLTFDHCEGLEDSLIPVPLDLELVDKNSEELLDVFISGVPDGVSFNKGKRNKDIWVLTPEDIQYLLIAPARNCADDLTLTVTASSKEKTLSQHASVIKDIVIDVIPVADHPRLELASSDIAGYVHQEVPIVFKTLQLTDTDGSEQWDRIEIVHMSSDLKFSIGTITNGKLMIDLSHQAEMDLSGWNFSVQASNESTYTFLIRVFSKEIENNDVAMREVWVKLSVRF